MKAARQRSGGVHESPPHDSAELHVTGEARYIDDLPEPIGTLHAAFGRATHAHARIAALDLARVRAAPGVVCVMGANEIPGANNVGPVVRDEPLFAAELVQFRGQPLFAVAAATVEQARRAAMLAEVSYEPLPAVITIEQALAQKQFVLPTTVLERGNPAVLGASAHRLQGRLRCGGQEHFYLEGQIALAIPGED